VKAQAMTLPAPHWIARLAADGYCIIPDAVPAGTIAALNADLDPHFAAQPCSIGTFYGERTKRFGALLNRSTHAETLVRHPLILQVTDAVLGPHCDRIALNLTQGIEIGPGAPQQYPHRDQDMWGGPKGEMEYLVNVMWPLVPFTRANGGTLIWPESHRLPATIALPAGAAVAPEMDPGAALIFLGSTLHGGGANITATPRRGIIISYCLGWLKPFELQWLVYPPEIARGFDPELAALVGYAQHRPNLGNVEGQCPSRLLHDEAMGPFPATDALRPDQNSVLARWTE
jgi:ectoine hydroxylase-related dioxygenase (phytanoyl-CoA dioxygenase family)